MMLRALDREAKLLTNLDRWLSVKIKYSIVQEIFLDLEYEKLMGRLSEEEQELLSVGLRCWADLHFGARNETTDFAERCTRRQRELFWSRFEEKLDEKLAAVGGDTLRVGCLRSLSRRCLEERQHISRIMHKYTQIFQDVGATQVELFNRRIHLQKELLLQLGKTMGAEAKALSSRTCHLQTQIHTCLLRPSQKANELRDSYEALVEEKARLEARYGELSRSLETLMTQKQKFLQLANQRADAQRQMTFLRQLQQPASSQIDRANNGQTDGGEKKHKQNFIFTNL